MCNIYIIRLNTTKLNELNQRYIGTFYPLYPTKYVEKYVVALPVCAGRSKIERKGKVPLLAPYLLYHEDFPSLFKSKVLSSLLRLDYTETRLKSTQHWKKHNFSLKLSPPVTPPATRAVLLMRLPVERAAARFAWSWLPAPFINEILAPFPSYQNNHIY